MKEYLGITGSKKILDLYNGWPSFHDAEVVSLLLDRNRCKGKYGPTVTVKIHCFTITNEVVNGHYKTTNHALITVRFYDVVEFLLEHGFGTQNPLSGFFVEDIRTHQLEGMNYEVYFGAHLNCDMNFKCSAIEVISLEEGIPPGSIYV